MVQTVSIHRLSLTSKSNSLLCIMYNSVMCNEVVGTCSALPTMKLTLLAKANLLLNGLGKL